MTLSKYTLEMFTRLEVRISSNVQGFLQPQHE